MWPFKKQDVKIPELKSIRFGNNEYHPLDDITVREVALLLPLFASIPYRLNREEYVKKHNLERHFKKVEQ